MPIQVQGPDGQLLEFPDGTSRDVMRTAMQKRYGGPQRPASADENKPDWESEAQKYGVGKTLGEHARDVYDQSPLYQRVLGSAGAEFDRLGRGIAQIVTPNDSGIGRRIQAGVDENAPFQNAPHGASAIAGRVLPYLAAAPLSAEGAVVSKLPSLGRLGTALTKGAVAAAEGAGAGALGATATGESRLGNAIQGAVGGAVGRGVVGALRAPVAFVKNSIPESKRAIYELAKQYGVELTPAQLSDSRLIRYMAKNFGMLPGSGGDAVAAQQSAQVNRGIAKAIGADADVVTPEVYAKTKVAQSRKFDDLTSRNNLQVTPDLALKLRGLQQEANVIGGEVGDTVRNVINSFYDRMDADGVVTGKAYQTLDSLLGHASRNGDIKGHWIGQVRGAIRDAMDASISPQDRAAWSKLRQEYGDRKTIRDLVAKSDGDSLSPTALMGRVTANNSGKERMASGTRGTLGDLARIGQAMKPVNTSGTPETSLVRALINPLHWPELAAGTLIGRYVNSPAIAARAMKQPSESLLARLAGYLPGGVPAASGAAVRPPQSVLAEMAAGQEAADHQRRFANGR